MMEHKRRMDEDADQGDERPWERLGVMRRDCLPHRGELLCALAGLSMELSIFTGPLGLAISVAIWIEAHKDVTQIRQGVMDRRGESKTVDARNCALMNIVFAVFATAFWMSFLLTFPR